ncbi:baseplate J/gp47 family protein [Christensenellaceae bacterium OttesenSCG-928-M15]|nr:baseplate J/gp47 family protein [Christensenellaceae bacterium OttesenSCG-928-M15]
MKAPLMDGRDHDDIIREIKEKALAYTPEWHYEDANGDPGGTLAELYAEFLGETLSRLNGVPRKNYIAFLNLLDVRHSPMTSARGVAKFTVSLPENVEENVNIPRGTVLYASLEEGDERTLFETSQAIQATGAELQALYYVNPAEDHMEKLELEEGALTSLFTMTPENNLQQHDFDLQQQDVFSLSHPCTITLEFDFAVRFYTDQCLEALADPGVCAWSYFDGEEFHAFDDVRSDHGALLLTKKNGRKIMGRGENGASTACIRCEIRGNGTIPPLQLSGAKVKSEYLENEFAPPDAAFHNENPVDVEAGGYCFGNQPVVYDCFYIASDEVFSKRGARVELAFDASTVRIDQVKADELYEFRRKYIIDKSEVNKDLPRIYVQRVIFEYWNGAGWRALHVEGDENPFSCQHDGEKTIHFICPEDMAAITVNALEGLFIRARVAFVENAFDTMGTLLLPLAKRMRLRYRYENGRSITGISVRNNCDEVTLENEAGLDALNVALYKGLKEGPPAHYLLFDKPLYGHPVTFYMKLPRHDDEKRLIQYEMGGAEEFLPLRAIDGTENFTRSGVVSLFIAEPLAKRRLFGEEGYWLKIADRSAKDAKGQLCLSRFDINAVEFFQRHTAEPMAFDVGIYEANLEITLRERPVLEAEVWVNEFKTIPPHILDEMRSDERMKTRIRVEQDDLGVLSAAYIKYERVHSFAGMDAQSRVYTLDQVTGVIRFGDGRRGRIPPEGEDAVKVEYKSGGGARGNMAFGAIDAFEGSLPMVSAVQNVVPACGGSDLQNIKTVERLGKKRLIHRGRALTAADYENLVEEQFPQIRDVRCFAGMDVDGNEKKSHVTVAVMGNGFEEEAYSQQLADEVYAYLKTCCDMQVLSLGLLHVLGAQAVTVNIRLRLGLDDFNHAAQAELSAKEAITAMIKGRRTQGHFIGNLPKRADVYAACKDIQHVLAVQDVMLEGSYVNKGELKLIALDEAVNMPFAVALPGKIFIKF